MTGIGGRNSRLVLGIVLLIGVMINAGAHRAAAVTATGLGSDDALLIEARHTVIRELDRRVPEILRLQNNDRTSVRHGQFRGDDIRNQEITYVLAHLIGEPQSAYYRDPLLQNAVVASIDYMTRAQGSNGGFTDHWVGVPTRAPAYNPVAGFTLYALAKSILALSEYPEFDALMQESIDVEWGGAPPVPRGEAWLAMAARAADWLMDSQRGHGPNQDVGNWAALYALDDAYAALHPEGRSIVDQERVDALVADSLSRSEWWSAQGMIKERAGDGPAGYDGHYGNITLYYLALLAQRNDRAAEHLHRFIDVFQYFIYPAERLGLDHGFPYVVEWKTASRVRQMRHPWLVAVALSQPYHPAAQVVYKKLLADFIADPKRYMDVGANHLLALEMYRFIDFLEYATPPMETDYKLPAESGEPFLYLDPESRILAAGTDDGRLIYVSLAWSDFIREAPYHVVGVDDGGIRAEPSRRLDATMVRSSQPYAFADQFPEVDTLLSDARDLVHSVLSIASVQVDIGSPLPGATVRGELAPQFSVSLAPHESLRSVTVDFGGRRIYDGPELPAALRFETQEFEDGEHLLTVTATTASGAMAVRSAMVRVENGWSLVDEFLPPIVLFGVLEDRAQTAEATDGWVYTTDHPDRFFGDSHRRVRARDTTEHLTWEAPRLIDFTVVVYATARDVGSDVKVMVSADGASWETVAYETEVRDQNETGWFALALRGVAPSHNIEWFRLTLPQSGKPTDLVQLGSVELRGHRLAYPD